MCRFKPIAHIYFSKVVTYGNKHDFPRRYAQTDSLILCCSFQILQADDSKSTFWSRYFRVILSQIRGFKIEMKWVVYNHFIEVKKSGQKSQVFSSLFCSFTKVAEVYIQRSAIITKGEKGSEMLPKKFGF